jgi:hypothetical protein
MKMISRKMKFKKFTGLFFAAVAATLLFSCSGDDDGNQSARVSVRMTDAPGDFDAVFVDVIDVMIKADAMATGEEGWTSLGNVQTGVYDLLSLTGGVTQLLADAQIPAGPLGQIRLVLGNNNSVVVNGETQPLSTPSAQQSGLKLQVNQTLEAGEQYDFLLDFNVDQSVVSAGSGGGFSLKPVIRVATLQGTGTIMGEVQPSNRQSLVKASNASNSISAYADSNGKFSLHGVPPGIYQVTVSTEAAAGLSVKTINNVEVTSQSTVDLDVIFLQ